MVSDALVSYSASTQRSRFYCQSTWRHSQAQMVTPTPRDAHSHPHYILNVILHQSWKEGRKERRWKGVMWEEKRVNAVQSTASRQRKTKRKTFSQLTFLIPTLPLLLKCWCWLGTPAVENYTGSVTPLSPLLEHQYRAAYGERKRSIKRRTVARENLVLVLSLSI